jgi:hypothetical protein
MTVGELREKMTYEEFAHWLAFFSLESDEMKKRSNAAKRGAASRGSGRTFGRRG